MTNGNVLDLLKLLLKNCEGKRVSETLMRVYISQGLDPHVNRKRFRAQWVEWWIGYKNEKRVHKTEVIP